MFARLHRTKGLEVALLVLNSCESTVAQLPEGVEAALVAAGGHPLQIDAIDFDRVLEADAPSLKEAFTSVLVPAPFELANDASRARRARAHLLSELLHRGPFFIPLGLWVVVMLRRSRGKASQET
jgi:hypothetical protein